MPLVSMKEMLIDAKENGYAVGQYNINNLEFTQAILEGADPLVPFEPKNRRHP